MRFGSENFNNFDFNAFIAERDFNSFENILGISDPDSAHNCGYRFLLLSLINMLHIALKQLKLDSIITGLPVKLNFN